MAYLTGDVPIGDYDSNRLANIGIGHYAVDAGAAYTYLSARRSFEFSTLAGLTYNFENPSTDYKNGLDSHLGYELSWKLTGRLDAGLAGYVYHQLTGDSGSGASQGSFESQVAAIGPRVGYAFQVGEQPWYLSGRGYYEFRAENRTEGFALYVSLNIPLRGGKK